MAFCEQADVVVIGGGIVGTAILRELSKYELSSVLLEAEPDLASGTTKANSAILHAGFDAPTGSAKARTNVRGNFLYHKLKDELGLDIKWTGSLVVATNEEEMATLAELKTRGEANGVAELTILNREETLAREPHLREDICGALLAGTAGICWPFEAAVKFARCAVQNGAEVIRNCQVQDILVEDNQVQAVVTNQGTIKTKVVINAAGVAAASIAKMVGDTSFSITPRKGEYILFDKSAGAGMVNGVVFPTPTKTSKGCLVCATTHGNVFIGPNAQDMEDTNDHSVTASGMQEIIAAAYKLIPALPMGAAITEFAGLRAVSSNGDFVIGTSMVGGFINAAGMQSPGLTAAPAVAEEVTAAVATVVGPLTAKKEFTATLPIKKAFANMSKEEQAEAIANNPLYGRVICRCETITEGEIIEAIHQSCGACTVDGVKRRTRAGMGRCQGGFCGPRVTQIIARELNIPVTAVLKEGHASQMFYDKNNAGEETKC